MSVKNFFSCLFLLFRSLQQLKDCFKIPAGGEKMGITRKEVEYVAHLARLRLSEEEAEKFTSQLDQILSYFEKLQELDTSQVEPTSHPIPIVNAFREDEMKPSLDIEDVLANAPEKEGNFFKVPKIIE